MPPGLTELMTMSQVQNNILTKDTHVWAASSQRSSQRPNDSKEISPTPEARCDVQHCLRSSQRMQTQVALVGSCQHALSLLFLTRLGMTVLRICKNSWGEARPNRHINGTCLQQKKKVPLNHPNIRRLAIHTRKKNHLQEDTS